MRIRASPTFDPDVGADLYTTNGDTNDHMYKSTKTISFTPEGTAAATGSVFAFQDNEADVQAEFERHVQFALDLARSAPDPTHPKSHLGNKPANFVVDKFGVSYGNPQTVQVNARRDLGPIELHYRVNGGRTRTASTSEWQGGKRYGGEGDYWYHRMRGQVTGTKRGDNVEVWFSAEKHHAKSDSFTYNVRSDSGARVLVLAVEDYTGNSALPAYSDTTKPNYLDYYGKALAANGVDYDVYDYDAMQRKAPDPLGVLSHYDAVIWETGNDNVTRESATPGVSDAQAWETIMSVRDFVNEGGRVSVSGVNAGRQWDLVEYPTEGLPNSYCDGDLQTTDNGKCNPLSNDFAQYYLGAYLRSDAGGQDQDGNIFPVAGTPGGPLDGLTFDMNGADSAGNQGGERSRDRQLPGHLERPAEGPVSAVRERPGGRLAAGGRRGVRPAHGIEVHVLPEGGSGLQAHDAHGRPDGRDRLAAGEPVLLDVVQHGGRLGLRVRRGPDDQPGRQRRRGFHDAAGRQRAHERQHRLELPGGLVGAPPDHWSTTRRWSRTALAMTTTSACRPARPARGTPRPATRAAGRTGRST